MEKLNKSNRKLPRICAYFIDIIIVLTLTSLITQIRYINPNYDLLVKTTNEYSDCYNDYIDNKITINEYNKKMNEITYDMHKYATVNYIVSLFVVLGYFGIFQKFNNGQTIGKKIMKLRVISVDDTEVSLFNYLLRIMPIYLYGFGGIFTLLASIFLPHMIGASNLNVYISSISITNLLLSLIDIEFFLIRKDKRALHDILAKTIIIDYK